MNDAEPLSRTSAAIRAAQLNKQTHEVTTYGEHRGRVTALVLGARHQVLQNFGTDINLSLSVLGAGNCRDLDLAVLMENFAHLRLLDIDPQALHRGVAEQIDSKATHDEISSCLIHKLAPVDLASPLATLEPEDVSEASRCALTCDRLRSAWAAPPTLRSNVVVSTCVLSQIVKTLINLITERHPGFLPLLQAVRRGHLVRMLQLLEPGGQAVFVSDLVSSESVPGLLNAREADLPAILTECLKSGNFFSGLNPSSVIQDLKTIPELASACTDVRAHAPWIWTMGPRRYAVYAVSFQRKPQA